ncbi:Histidine kinase-, DNA gyrase B-, and HSP90-like ATPase [compost metagenome]
MIREQDEVLIRISDNGVGIDQEKLSEMPLRLSRMSQQGERVWSTGTSIGLVNAASRIVMHFGPAYGMSIESEQGQGTSVMIRIPCSTGGERL